MNESLTYTSPGRKINVLNVQGEGEDAVPFDNQ